jgi:hypothetical protein
VVWRGLIAGALAVSVFAGASAAAAPNRALTCGRPTPVDRSAPIGRAIPFGRLLWLGVYPFTPGYPTKAVVMARRPLSRAVAIGGWNCASGEVLRVWYREGVPFVRMPVSVAELKQTGDRHASFGPWPSGAMRGGYLLFWRSGRWKLVAVKDGHEIASVIVRTAPA